MTRGEDGGFVVAAGSTPTGQGHHTLFAQIAADRLGIDAARVTVRTGDTDAIAARRRLLRQPHDGHGRLGGRGGRGRPARGRPGRRPLRVRPGLRLGRLRGGRRGRRARRAQVRVRRLVAVDDAGRIVNPLLAEGQVVGGSVQGLGAVLTEEVAPRRAGQPVSASLLDYALMTAAEIPEFATAFVETPSPFNPLGAQGRRRGRDDRRARRCRQRPRGRARRPPRRPAVHRREGLAGASVTPWEQLSALPPLRDEHGTIVLEEIDDDTHTATFRVYGRTLAHGDAARRRRAALRRRPPRRR